jgi:hypothetical protein
MRSFMSTPVFGVGLELPTGFMGMEVSTGDPGRLISDAAQEADRAGLTTSR